LDYQLFELELCDSSVAVGVYAGDKVVDVRKGGLLHVEGHGNSADQLPKFIFLKKSRVVNIELFEGGGQFFGSGGDHFCCVHL
jgi:hypothetical protein